MHIYGGISMIEMTDAEFIERIKARLREKGWKTGSIGTADGPNCLLGAAGFVAHNGDLVTDEAGVHALYLNGEKLSGETYDEVPGMARLAKVMGLPAAYDVVSLNDDSHNLEEAIAKMDQKLNV